MLNTLFGSKADMAVKRLREFEPQALSMHHDGYYCAFSGGKDSIVLLDLVRKSGVKHTAHFNLTTVDPPELIYFIRDNYPDVEVHKPARSMWQLFRDKMMPPTRVVRYCCEALKEGGGCNRMVLTGIRWQESVRRSKRGMVESCNRDKHKRYLHPIIDWLTEDVWEYIRSLKLKYPSLYDEGRKRIGCIGCPMSGPEGMKRDFIRWPKYYAAYERAAAAAANRMKLGNEYGINGERHLRWDSGKAMMDWWLRKDSGEQPTDGGLFDNVGGAEDEGDETEGEG